MILYIEKIVKNYSKTKEIIEKVNNASIIFINNYKNIFDKNIGNLNTQKAIILAELKSDPITLVPPGYGHTGNAYFFKTSLNCVFDCSYCFLKGAFKSENQVYFLNYNDIKKSINSIIENNTSQEKLWFYSSDYSDILGMDNISGFIKEFVSFFEGKSNTMMEIRTKSANIKALLDLLFIPKNTEIAFSLNPQSLIDKYEKGTSSLDDRIKAINTLINLGFKVGLRFLPLLPVKGYMKIYSEFTKYIAKNIDISKIYSNFASGLLYTRKDYNKIIKKYPDLDILYYLELSDDDFYRESKIVRENLYNIFKCLDKKCMLCLEN